jgi:hypothetical protein
VEFPKRPAGQSKQSLELVDPLFSVYFAIGHKLQEEDPDREYVCRSQVTHVLSKKIDEVRLPAEQGVQSEIEVDPFEAVYVPLAQSVHEVNPFNE